MRPSRRHYHASLSPEEREGVQAEWTNGDVPIIVATIAFGMGGCSCWCGGCVGPRGWWMAAGIGKNPLAVFGRSAPAPCPLLPAISLHHWTSSMAGQSCVLCATLPLSACVQASTRLMCGLFSTTRCPSPWRDTCRQAGTRLPAYQRLAAATSCAASRNPDTCPAAPCHLVPPPPRLNTSCPFLPAGERACGARRPPLLLHPLLHLRRCRQVTPHDPPVGAGEWRP